MKLYLVTSNTYDSYGAYYYVVGLFSSKKRAEEKVEKIKKTFIGQPCELFAMGHFRSCRRSNKNVVEEDVSDLNIVEIEVDKDYDILINADINSLFTTELFIGGYDE